MISCDLKQAGSGFAGSQAGQASSSALRECIDLLIVLRIARFLCYLFTQVLV
jgi:hypothetical protein